ncbi:MAG: HAD family hydrolase [Atopobiaceae bacterium]|jgi:Cof subfamily protein (haloacid dehalogenase superfamily)
MVQLILTDIDGTILPAGHEQLGDKILSAFHTALDAGIAIGPSSGRGSDWLKTIFREDTACFDTAVATNGLEVYLKGTTLRQLILPRELICQLVDAVKDVPKSGVICFSGYNPFLLCGRREDLALAVPRYAETCQEVGEVPHTTIVKANIFTLCPEEETLALARRLTQEIDGLDLDFGMPTLLNVMPHGINKASGIDLLVKAMGIDIHDVVVFGDANNDLSMLNHVPNSVAVANATEEAKAAARWHIGSCADDAVADAIFSLAQRSWPFDK